MKDIEVNAFMRNVEKQEWNGTEWYFLFLLTFLLICLNVQAMEINLYAVEMEKKWEEIKRFIDLGDVNSKLISGSVPLHHAAKTNFDRMLYYLLKDYRVEVDPINNYGETPLHLAAAYGCSSSVVGLLEYGANVTIKDGNRKTPWDRAISCDHKEIAEILRLASGDVNVHVKDGDGLVPLHHAVDNGYKYLGSYFLQVAKVDVNCRDKDGWTALHYAISGKEKSILHLLLAPNNINVDQKNNLDTSPLALAKSLANDAQNFGQEQDLDELYWCIELLLTRLK